MKKIKTCKNCNGEFSNKNRTFCSEQCQHQNQIGKRRVIYITQTCVNCGNVFQKLPNKHRATNIYCSRKCSDKHKKNQKIGIFNPDVWIKTHSDVTKQKHKIIALENWKTPEYRSKVKDGQLKKYKEVGVWFGSDGHSKEKRRLTNIAKYGVDHAGWNVPEIRKKLEQTCINKYGKNTWELSQKRRQNTSIEKIIEILLIENGIAYLKQFKIFYTNNKYKMYDFYIPQSKILIEADGDYWHGNPSRYTTLSVVQQNRVYLDRSQDAYLKTCGFYEIRFWENEIWNKYAHCAKRLQDLLVSITKTTGEKPK